MRDNPIWYREARHWRRPRRWRSLLVYPALLLSPTLLAWLSTHESDYAARSAYDMAFVLTIFLHVLYFSLRALISTTGVVARERERGTFEALATTRTTAAEAVRASLFWALAPRAVELLAFGWLLLLLPQQAARGLWTVPVLLLCTVPYALAYAALGLWLSARARRTAVANGVGMLVMLVNFIGVALLEIVAEQVSAARGPWLSWALDPWVSAIGLVCQPPRSGEWWLLCPLLHLVFFGVFYRLAVRRLAAPEAGLQRRHVATRRWHVPFLTENPVLYRELLRTSRSGMGWLLAYPILVVAPSWLVSRFLVTGYQETALAVLLALCLHATYMGVRSIAAGSRAVALEREQRTWEPLLASRLSGREVVRGKLLANLFPVLAPLACFGWTWLIYSPFLTIEKVAGMLAYSALLAVLLFAFSLWLSLRGLNAAQVGLFATGALLAAGLGTICVDSVIRGPWLLSQLSPVYVMACYLDNGGNDCYWSLALGPYTLALFGLLANCRARLGR